MREVLAHRQNELLALSPSTGVEALRIAIAEHLRSFRALDVDPGRIVVGAGSEYLYGVVARLLGAGKTVCLEDPGYAKAGAVYGLGGERCLHLPIDAAGMRSDALRTAGADAAHISPSHQFPSGVVMPVARRYELLGWANEAEGRYIVEDDYDSEFRLSGRPLPTLAGIDASGRVLYLNTFSKTLSPTIRISYLVLPEELLERYRRQLGFLSCTVSNFEQYALAAFLSGGHFERHLSRMRVRYRRKRDLLLGAIRESPLGRKARITEEGAGLHFLLAIPSLTSDGAFVARCAQADVRIEPVSRYYREPGAAPAHAFLVNYSGLSDECIPEAVARLAAFSAG